MTVEPLAIRPATAEDAEASKAELPDLLPDRWRAGGNRRSLVAIVDERVVGHVRGVDNAVHPRTRVLTVEVLPNFRRRGIGTALVQAQLAVSDRPLTLTIEGSMTAVRALARRFGAIAYQACPPWRYSAATLRPWAEVAPAGLTESFDPHHVEELHELWVRHYLVQHATWNPAAEDAVHETLGKHLAAGLDHDRTTVLRRAGEIVAAALVWPPESDRSAELNLICQDHEAASARPDQEACLAEAIRRSRDTDELLIDSHVTEPLERAMIMDLPGPLSTSGADWTALVQLPNPSGPVPIPLPSGLLPPPARWIEQDFNRALGTSLNRH